MNVEFSSDFFVNNRKRLRSLFKGTAPIALTANGLMQDATDSSLTFDQDSSFWYFTGIDVPSAILVIDKDREYLILPNQTRFQIVSDGELNIQELIQASGIKDILDTKAGWKLLGGRLKRAKYVAVLAPAPEFVEEIGFFTQPARAYLVKQLKKYNQELKLLDLRNHVIKLRSVKQDNEIQAIQVAIDLTVDTFKIIKKDIAKFKYSNEVEAVIMSTFYKHGSRPAFGSVVACGKNACAIHYDQANQEIKDGEFVVVDIGAEVNHYAADITRTFTVNKISKRQRQVYESVKEVQDYAFSLLKPGLTVKEYEEQVAEYMGEQLRVLGLIKSIDQKSVRKYYPHATSHFLGLDVHDVGDYYAPLEPNMVLTVEPGIYIQEEGIGIRIEDDVVVTDKGISIMTSNLPSIIN